MNRAGFRYWGCVVMAFQTFRTLKNKRLAKYSSMKKSVEFDASRCCERRNRSMKKSEKKNVCRARQSRSENLTKVRRNIAKTLPNHCQDERPCPSVLHQNILTQSKTIASSLRHRLSRSSSFLRAALPSPFESFLRKTFGGGAEDFSLSSLSIVFTLAQFLYENFLVLICRWRKAVGRGKVRKLFGLFFLRARLLDDKEGRQSFSYKKSCDELRNVLGGKTFDSPRLHDEAWNRIFNWTLKVPFPGRSPYDETNILRAVSAPSKTIINIYHNNMKFMIESAGSSRGI